MLKLKNVSKFYYNKGIIASGFSKVNLELKIGEFVVITGESGSGKSTLLNVISGLDSYEEGEMYINGNETSHYTEKDFEDYRRKYIGNIFQNFNLVNSYTVFQNIELVLLLNGAKKKDVKDRVIELIKKVDLYKFRNTKVSKLSGGQKQRVAIARALAKDTPIIIADEPTGNLDSRSAGSIIKLLADIAKDKLVIIVTHNYEQVEEYVTRKIKMHDGKVLEDKQIVKVEDIDNDYEQVYKNITFLNKIRLGLRNTFNVIPKFLLMLFVYFFITIALVGIYTSLKKMEYEESILGQNNFFNSISNDRIILKKNDKTPFSKEEIEKISKLDNVKKVVENDLLLDNYITLSDDNFMWFNGLAKKSSELKKVDIGRLPENDNEIAIIASTLNYSPVDENIIDKVLYYQNLVTYELEKTKPLTVVGISFSDDVIVSCEFYLPDDVINKLQTQINNQYSDIEIDFLNKTYYQNSYRVIPSNRVAPGQAYFSDNMRYLCKDFNCINQRINIRIKNLYYQDSMNVGITNYYKNDNFNALLGYSNDDFVYYDYSIFVNEQEYNNLFNKDTYQMSVFIEDEDLLDQTLKDLDELNIHTLNMRDARIVPTITAAMNILKTSVIICVVIVLFFICYFVIKLILKSRNTYFATIRMLGANKNVSIQLITIELFTITNLAYLMLLSLIKMTDIKIIDVKMLSNMLKYLVTRDYILLYIILVFMSLMVSTKFSQKLFKNSAMKSLREES